MAKCRIKILAGDRYGHLTVLKELPSKICNRAKSTLSKEEFLNWITQVYNYSCKH